MTSRTAHTPERKRMHRWLVLAAQGAAGLLLAAVLVFTSWNLFAPEMFGADPMRFRHALGLVVFAGVLAALLRLGTGGASSWPPLTLECSGGA